MSVLHHTVTIALNAQLSGAVDLGGYPLCGVYIPAAFTGTAMTFEACDTLTGTYVGIKDGASDYSITVAAGKYCPVNPEKFRGVRFLKVKSGSAEAAARSVKVASNERA